MTNVSPRAIQANSVHKSAGAIVLSEAKSDFTIKSLRQYADVVLKKMRDKSKIENRVEKGPKEVKINGKDAIQDEVSGSVGNVKIQTLNTFIQTDTRWNHVQTWTEPSHWDEDQDDFRTIYESLKEQPK